MQPVFDGHNDTLLALWRRRDLDGARFLDPETLEGHIDLPRARTGGLTGGLFATFVPPGGRGSEENVTGSNQRHAEPVPQREALAIVVEQAGVLARISHDAPARLRQCRSVAEIERAEADGALAAVLHLEGADAIDEDLGALELLHAAGLRSIGPVWSRQNAFGFGVPFRFPHDPDIGPGLTEAGLRLVRRCNELNVLIDLSHLNGAGFWDVANTSDAPLVATHSNAHAISPSSRNLTDDQLRAIAESGGLVGLNFATFFLRPDGKAQDVGLDAMLRHLDHLMGFLGEDGVALGSDFDGAPPPSAIKDASGYPALVAAMRGHVWGDALIAKVCHDNWLGLLRRVWGG